MKNRLFTQTAYKGILLPFSLLLSAICLAQPANDNCNNALLITANPNGTCNKTLGTTAGATVSGTPLTAPCAGTVGPDVWYRFVAISPTATITIADFGANFGATRRVQLFNGACGSLTNNTCATGTGGSVTINATALTVGNTYYVRVYSGTLASPANNADFTICVFTPPGAQRYGNSYVNITKQTTGGPVQNGDVLEIRMTINHTAGTIYRMRYVDNIPTNTTMITTEPIRIITNEGLTYKQYTATANVNDDAATYRPSPPFGHYNIRMNLGFVPTAPGAPLNNSATDLTGAGGQMIANGTGNNRPRGGGGMLFATAFRVRVTGAVGDTITLGAGKFIYRNVATGGSDIELTATPYKILISDPMSLCSNATGVNNAAEFGGTFGLGNTLNRPTDLNFPIPSYTFVNSSYYQSVNDGQYSVVKNISPRDGTNRTAERTPTCPTGLPSQNACANRMHGGHWDIDGDHTGTSNSTGNIPPGAGVSGGYMLMVNADYVASETYRQTLNNLCPNTYYEFSAWIRNICPTCGIDSTGTTYSPRRPGVLPNLTFSLDGVDRYSTGEVAVGGWIKKGFMFISGDSPTATFSIRNNSQGGGGNDWVIDDITVATCLPNMAYSPSLSPTVCAGNSMSIDDTIRSFFNNYGHHQWQRSTDGGTTWSNVGGIRDSIPYWNASLNTWEYYSTYTIPPGNTAVSNSGDMYRVIVATTEDNLSDDDCQVTDGVSIITLSVLDCTPTLKTELLTLNGRNVSGNAHLSWTSSKEEQAISYHLERSTNGRNFVEAGTVAGYNNGSETNHYSYIDPVAITDRTWYRVVMLSADGAKKYSSTIQMRNEMPGFDFVKVINPFNNQLEFDLSTDRSAVVQIDLINITGKTVRSSKQQIYAGVNSLFINNTQNLPVGVYTLRIVNENKVLFKRVLKN